ncbi:MAG: pilus assembly protein TadG-related protein [Chlorobiaceae bacterium]
MEPSPEITNRFCGQRGAVTIWFALFLPVLLGFVALAVDMARINLAKTELQNAADAAALGGARVLTPAGSALSDKPYNWSAAMAMALTVAQRNYANGAQIHNATIETGYWDITARTFKTTVGTNCVPAVRATVALSSTLNNGPLTLFFAPIFSFFDHADHTHQDKSASAIAMIASPTGGTGVFPYVIDKRMLDNYWDSSTQKPVLKNGAPVSIKLGSVYQFGTGKNAVSVLSGQWSPFSVQKNPSTPVLEEIVRSGNTTKLSIGQSTYVDPGNHAAEYGYVDSYSAGKDVALFVVNEVKTDALNPIVGIVAFHIDSASQGGKYITGHFVDATIIPGLTAGGGSGVFYGAYTPPMLVQ